jgi:haloalkane dehalogenase
VGFGRSDKPSDRSDYTYARHVGWTRALLFDSLGLSSVTLFAQDWGGLIGLRLVGEHPTRFARVVASNTFLPVGEVLPEAFFRWRSFSQRANPPFPAGFVVRTGSVGTLSDEVVTAYDAPFPDESYAAGAREFPMLVPTDPDDPAVEANRAAWKILETFERPFLTAFGDRDPITAGADQVLRARIPGAASQGHTTVAGGHFIQEDGGPELARIVVRFMANNPLAV